MKPNRRLASLVAQLAPGQTAVRLLPAGVFRSADGSGRPADAPGWRVDADIAAQLIARNAARASRRVVDYEHQTLHAEKNGKDAPASGWIGPMEWREGDGVYAEIKWTARASAMIDAEEYRYISPVFSYDSTGQVLDILMAGLTNNPGLDGLTDLAALSAAFTHDLPPDQEKPEMNETLKKLLAALALPETTAEGDAIAAVATLKASSAAATAQIATLTAQVNAPDPAKFVPVDTVVSLQAQVAALNSKIEKKELDDMIEIGLSDGRILPDMEAWARSLNQAALKGYLDKAQPIAALGGTQTGGKSDADTKTGELTADQLAVCTVMGLNPAQYKATLAK